jgi:UDP-glucose 4-epimerase
MLRVRVAITGGAGFIGSNLVDALLEAQHEVTVVDNFSTGVDENLSHARRASHYSEIVCDLYRDPNRLAAAIDGSDAVVHLAANADVRFGWDAPRRDLEQNVIATHNLLEAMRQTETGRCLFSSTGSVYGETDLIPTPEDAPFPVQTSLYGASKLAAEGYLAAYAEGVGISVTVFRFVSILGLRYSHGHVIDFVRQLLIDPRRLTILGDGSQRKSYLDVSDCVTGIIARLEERPEFEVLNLGVDDYCTVRESAAWICERMGISPELEFAGGERGWIGDNPFIFLDTSKMRHLGWVPEYSIRDAIERTVDDLLVRLAP